MWPDAVRCLVDSFFSNYLASETKLRSYFATETIDLWLDDRSGSSINNIYCDESKHDLLSVVIVWNTETLLSSNSDRVATLLLALQRNDYGVTVEIKQAAIVQ